MNWAEWVGDRETWKQRLLREFRLFCVVILFVIALYFLDLLWVVDAWNKWVDARLPTWARWIP